MNEVARLNREADRARLRRELEALQKSFAGTLTRSTYKMAEMACARLGVHREYGLELLGLMARKPVEMLSEKAFRAKTRTWDLKRRAG